MLHHDVQRELLKSGQPEAGRVFHPCQLIKSLFLVVDQKTQSEQKSCKEKNRHLYAVNKGASFFQVTF